MRRLLFVFIVSMTLLPLAARERIKVACVGNSVTYGYGLERQTYGGLGMPGIYSDGMVLQRDRPVEISGTADAGEKVTVLIAGQKKCAVAGPDGAWSVRLEPLSAATGLTLSVSTPKRHLRYNDVAAGEVWVCSGQSNMAFLTKSMIPEERSEVLETAGRQEKTVRLFNMKPRCHTGNVVWNKADCDSLNRLQYFTPTA